MLQVRDLHAGYGATPILFGVSLEVREGEAVALLGKNGMGKTTLMKTLMGFLTPWRGVIEFDGRSLARLRPHEIARLGVGFVPENRRVFAGLTVRENLELGLSAVAERTARLRAERLDELFLRFPRLRERFDQPAKTMSGLPGRSARCSRYRAPRPVSSRRTFSSGVVSRPLTRRMTAERFSGLKPSERTPMPVRFATNFSRPSKAPPQMNRMFEVLIWMKSWWGCLRPP